MSSYEKVLAFLRNDEILEKQTDVPSENNEAFNPYYCTICLEDYKSLIDFQRHFIKHVVNKPNQCPECNKSFFKESSLEKHLDHHEVVIEYSCEICQEVFPKKSLLKTHAESHNLVCELCDETLPSISLLKAHVDAHYFSKYSCNACFESFPDDMQLHQHERSHNALSIEAVLYNCMLCDVSFMTMHELESHMDGHETIVDFTCKKCAKTFFYSYCLKRHQNEHNYTVYCNVCGDNFINKKHLHDHEKFHVREHLNSDGIIFYSCELCDATFTFKKEIECHYDEHKDGKNPFPCLMCEKDFLLSYLLSKHKMTHIEFRETPCKLCQKKYKSESQLRLHMKSTHLEKNFICSVCQKRFHSRTRLRLHCIIHTDNKNYMCPFCPAKFSTKANLQRHYSKHKTEGEMYCPKCDKHFTRWDGLNQHNMTQHQNSPFRCHICDKNLKTMEKLKKHHQRKHQGCTCNTCGKICKSLQSLQIHERTHTGEKPFKCKACYKDFSQHAHLSVHYKNQHPGYQPWPFKCSYCEASYQFVRKFKSHHKLKHQGLIFMAPD